METKLTLKVYPTGGGRSAYRVIEVSDRITLADLCGIILVSFDFDDDHLYAFYMDNNARRSMAAYTYEGWGGDNSRVHVKLSQFGLVKGHKFILHYDFGDDWMFHITVQKAEEVENAPTRIIKSVGEVAQYPGCDEDVEW